MNKYLGVFLIVAITLAFGASADVMTPDPSMSVEQGFNKALNSNSAYGDASMLFRGLTAAVALIFTAWAVWGIIEAHIEEQIKTKATMFLIGRALAMLTVIIILINL